MNRIKRIAIVGCGTIGGSAAEFIDKKLKNKAVVCGLFDVDSKKSVNLAKKLKCRPKVYCLDDLIKKSDLVIEAASVSVVGLVLKTALAYKKDVVLMSSGGLIANFSLIKKFARNNLQIYLPSGAICGLDGLGAFSMGKIKEISLVTSKPPASLKGADIIKQKKIDLENLRDAKTLFSGSVAEAIKYFPKNINVAATLLFVSGFKKIKVSLKVDPSLQNNVHKVTLLAEEGKLSLEVENQPSKNNPKTSVLAILSLEYFLKKMFSSFKAGS